MRCRGSGVSSRCSKSRPKSERTPPFCKHKPHNLARLEGTSNLVFNSATASLFKKHFYVRRYQTGTLPTPIVRCFDGGGKISLQAGWQCGILARAFDFTRGRSEYPGHVSSEGVPGQSSRTQMRPKPQLHTDEMCILLNEVPN